MSPNTIPDGVVGAVAYCADSAGMHPDLHTLPVKIRAIAKAGFRSIELSFMDLEGYAGQLSEKQGGYQRLGPGGEGDLEKLRSTAKEVRALCTSLHVEILAVHSPERSWCKTRFVEARFRLVQCPPSSVAPYFRSDLPTTPLLMETLLSSPTTSASYLIALRNKTQLSKLLMRCVLGAVMLTSYRNTWEHAWDIYQRVDRRLWPLPGYLPNMCSGVRHANQSSGSSARCSVKPCHLTSEA